MICFNYKEGINMPSIVPVSDLRNYNAVIGQVSYGNPVYLTKNGRGDCAIVDMKELDELRAIKSLFSELEKGEVSARKDGWISLEEAKKRLGL
jgi:prevent-host-death family protein